MRSNEQTTESRDGNGGGEREINGIRDLMTSIVVSLLGVGVQRRGEEG